MSTNKQTHHATSNNHKALHNRKQRSEYFFRSKQRRRLRICYRHFAKSYKLRETLRKVFSIINALRGFIFLPCGAKDTITQQTTKTKAATTTKRPTNNTTNTKTTNYEKAYLRTFKRTSNSPAVIQPMAARTSRGTRVPAPD